MLVLAAVVQAVFVGSAVWYSEMMPVAAPVTPPKLVPEVVSPEDTVFDDSDVAARKGKQLPPVDVFKVATGDTKQLQEGARLFTENCASCHGPAGRGDGPAGKTLQPAPRNLTQLTGWKNPTRLSDIFRTLTLGLPGTRMPAFDYLTHQQRFALAHFVVAFARGHQADTEQTLAGLDKEFSLAAGAKEPNVIPVATAMQKMLAEGAAAGELKEAGPENGAGPEVFERVIEPRAKDRLARLLSANPSWRENAGRLKTLASEDPVAAGLRPRVRLLAETDWQTLYTYLKNRYPAANQ